jgi:hypothetical protein
MVAPLLTNDERAALETIATCGPEGTLDQAMRGRLALYRLIDETPKGWTITPLGRESLALLPPRQGNAKSGAPGGGPDGIRARPADGKRHYGRKSRNTSWLD